VWWLPVSGAWIGQSYGTFDTGGTPAKLCGGGGEAASHSSPLASQGLNGRDLRLALIEAGEGRGSTLADRLTPLCDGYDAVRGVSAPLIERILSLAAASTVLGIGLDVVLLHRRSQGAAGS
jgi:protein SCO1/2